MSKKRPNAGWKFDGRVRPDFAIEPAAGEESVWDYPRPPRLASDARLVVVEVGGRPLARTRRSLRVLETASPPTFYLPPADVRLDWLQPAPGHSFCEWKGEASYYDYAGPGGAIEGIGWTYPDPLPAFQPITDWIAFYPSRVSCTVDGERVRPQPGGFYGGWMTNEIVGPVKGDPGSEGW